MIPLVGNGDDTRVDSCAAVPQTKLYDRSPDTPRRRQMPQLRTAPRRLVAAAGALLLGAALTAAAT
ncbi:hypothetical protein, partial [Micromonospora sp. 4G55]|uniref:hypothetical protein n=1 Tax=Micromonospora sp. 4G55 TaxID=2806102 RepID=UPI001EE436C2